MATPKTKGFVTEASEESSIDHVTIPIEQLKIETIQLSDLRSSTTGNPILPIGFFFNGERLQEYTLHPIRTKHDRILGQLLNSPKVRMAEVLSEFFPQVIATVGGYSFTDLASKLSTSPKQLIKGMYLGDALAMLLEVRRAAQGYEVAMSGQCPICATKTEDDPRKGRGYHDLQYLDIKTLESPVTDKLVVDVELQDGIQRDVLIKHVHMQPLKLYQWETLGKVDRAEPGDIALLYMMISALPESEQYRHAKGQVFGDELYDDLTFRDKEILQEATNVLTGISPNMNVEMDCCNVSCRNTWEVALPWGRPREFLFDPPKPPK